MLSYSRARGVFAGLELSGAAIKQDKDSTRDFYGRMVPFRTSLQGTIDAPAGPIHFYKHCRSGQRLQLSRTGMRSGTGGSPVPAIDSCTAGAIPSPRFLPNASATRVRISLVNLKFWAVCPGLWRELPASPGLDYLLRACAPAAAWACVTYNLLFLKCPARAERGFFTKSSLRWGGSWPRSAYFPPHSAKMSSKVVMYEGFENFETRLPSRQGSAVLNRTPGRMGTFGLCPFPARPSPAHRDAAAWTMRLARPDDSQLPHHAWQSDVSTRMISFAGCLRR